MKCETEIWKDIIDYENLYQISNIGRVKSFDQILRGRNNSSRKIKGRILVLDISKTMRNFYPKVTLVKNNVKTRVWVHRLVAQAFIPNPENKPCVNHINGIKTDNRVENLEWVTISENSKHAYKIGLITYRNPHGENSGNARLTLNDVIEIRNYLSMGGVQKDLAKKFKVSQSQISAIKNFKSWTKL